MIVWFTLLILVLLYIWDKYGFKDPKFVKCSGNFSGPPTWPIIGNAYLYLTRKTEDAMPMVFYYFNTYGDTMRIWSFKRFVILTRDPRLYEVLLSNQKQLSKNDLYTFLYDWLGSGLLLSTGQKWFQRRKIITPTFHFKILQQFVDVFNYQSQIFVDKIKEKMIEEPFDIYNIVTMMSLDIICQTAMGVEIHAQTEDSEYAKTVKEMTYLISDRMIHVWKRPNFIYQFTADKRRLDRCLKIVHSFTRKIIEKRREQIVDKDDSLMENFHESVGIKKRMALLDVLLKSTINGKPLTNAEIAEEVDTFMFEGHDTVTAASTFTLYLLSQNPHSERKVYEEVTSIVGSDLSVHPTYNQLLDMKYLECVIKESLRMYPPVPAIGRQLDEDLNVDGIVIPAGTNINLMIYNLNMDRKYFNNPEEFIPERFSEENIRNENPFIYVPFSAGPRNCIGQKFAMLELKSTLCNVVRNFKLVKSDKQLNLIAQLTLKSTNGVHVGFKVRK